MSGPADAGDAAGVDLDRFWGGVPPAVPPDIARDGPAIACLEEPSWWEGSQPLRPALEAVYAAVARQAASALAALAAAPDAALPQLPGADVAAQDAPAAASPAPAQPRAVALPGFEDAVRGLAPRRAGWRWR